MKKILFSIFFAFAISALFSQNYFNTTTSPSGSNLDVSHLGTLTLGTTFEILNDPWRAGEGRLIELFKNSGNVSMMLGNSSGKFSINVSGHNSAFFPDSQAGDVVLRKHSGENIFFSLNNTANDGNHAFVFGDNLNKNTLTVLNNGRVGVGTTTPTSKLNVLSSEFIISRFKRSSGGAVNEIENGSGDAWRYGVGGNKSFAIYKSSSNVFGQEFLIDTTGKVGIGTITPDERLTVKGKIHAEEVRLDLNIAPDFVFQKYYTGKSSLKGDYKMLTVEEVEVFTKKNHHLPEIPSAKEIKKEGLNLKQMTTLLLQKVEELTLYTIEQEKRIKKLEQKLKETKK